MPQHSEDDVIKSLTAGEINAGSLGTFSALGLDFSGGLGLSLGDPSTSFNPAWAYEDGAVGTGQGDDWEDTVDAEMVDHNDDDDEVKAEAAPSPGLFSPPAPRRRLVTKTRTVVIPRKPNVRDMFPAFDPARPCDFTELFKGRVPGKSRVNKTRMFRSEVVQAEKRPRVANVSLAPFTSSETRAEIGQPVTVAGKTTVDDSLRKALSTTSGNIPIPLDDRSFDPIILDDWEDQIIYDRDSAPKKLAPRPSATAPLNPYLTHPAYDWDTSILWTRTTDPSHPPPALDDPHLHLPLPPPNPPTTTTSTTQPKKKGGGGGVGGGGGGVGGGGGKDKYNLSNDHYYEVSRERQRVRQTFGNLVVQHAYPAMKLQLPFYKTRLTKQEARAFHRPALQIPANIEFRFTRVRNLKKKKDKSGRRVVNEILKKTSDLTSKDNSAFVLWEYSEEHPSVISNFGMGSVLVNYYRKKDEKDDYIPKGDLGEPFVLEPNDESPFFKYGSIQHGQTIPAMYNNLVRAPLFKHAPSPTDFLVIKSTTRGESKYYIREIKHLYVIGQTFPVIEVPGPHSRKITHTIKQRLIIIACKLLSKSKHERLKISRLMKYFPDQNELQMRQRLKAYLQDFMEYHRRGEHQTFWRLKPSFARPSPADMLKMVEPEHVVLSESMIVGQRHLLDAGYGKSEADLDVKDGDEGKLDTEQQLAPWITTKNFIHATQGKAMLKLHGEGDPTGRGEGFSFIRVSMKEIFVPAGEDPEELNAEANSRPKNQHRYNVAQQQQVYKSEIERIWRAQYRSLSNKVPPELTAEEASAPMYKQPKEPENLFSKPSGSGSGSGLKSRHSSLGAMSRASSVDRDGLKEDGKSGTRVLRIRRQAADGSWTTEIVRNDNVISAYVARRMEIEEENMRAEDYVPTGDKAKDERMKAKLLEQLNKMKKNQERRLNRKNAKAIEAGEAPMPMPATAGTPDAPGRERRCGNCGQLGHMKTNRKCPRWAEFNQPNAGPPTPAAGPGAGSPTNPSTNLPTRQGSSAYFPAATSPLATSPPITADQEPDEYSGRAFSPPAGTPTGLKLKLPRP
ncbi:hypothetical protein FRC09_020515, partial [Ceratobasidium sp. 395]